MATKLKIFMASMDRKQTELVKRTGYSPTHISRIVNEDYPKIPDVAKKKIARALDVPIEKVF